MGKKQINQVTHKQINQIGKTNEPNLRNYT